MSEVRRRWDTLVDLLRHRAEARPEALAFTFLADGETESGCLTFGELDRRARSMAALLAAQAPPGTRACLFFPPGLDYIAALFGCLYAGLIAVPAYPPRSRRRLPRLEALIEDPDGVIALSSPAILALLRPSLEAAPEAFRRLRWITEGDDPGRETGWKPPQIGPHSTAVIQYTSGSTAAARGVMLSHANLLHNLGQIQERFGLSGRSRGVIWLPPYHDMGLIGGILEPVFAGFDCVLMSPTAFLQRPFRWLQAISRYHATISGGPNFAFDLCTRRIPPADRQNLDLGSWELAFNGAEPVRPETIERFVHAFAPCGFRGPAFRPCYGLAEATLMVTSGRVLTEVVTDTVDAAALSRNRVLRGEVGKPAVLAGCGPAIEATRILIVDPESLSPLPPESIGEIWVAGPSVAQGYYNRPEDSESVFGPAQNGTRYLRTGDLGYLRDGELFVTGRLKDLVIIRGANYYPHDIEAAVESCHPAIRRGCGAAFSLDGADGERLIVVQEVERQPEVAVAEIAAAARSAVAEALGLEMDALVLLKAGTIPKTSSGKVRRRACRDAYLEGHLDIAAEWRARSAAPGMPRGGDGRGTAEWGRQPPAPTAEVGAEWRPQPSAPGTPTAEDGSGAGGRGRRLAPTAQVGLEWQPQPTAPVMPSAGDGPGVAERRPTAPAPSDAGVGGWQSQPTALGMSGAGDNPGAAERRPAAPVTPSRVGAIERWLAEALSRRLDVPVAEIDPRRPFTDYGLESADAVGLAVELEAWLGRPAPPMLLWDFPSIESLARHLAQSRDGQQPAPADPPAVRDDPIAVIGMACRFPGADDPEAFWKLLAEGRAAVRETPSDRWSSSPRNGHAVRWGAFLDAVDQFDPYFFGIAPREAVHMDPQQRVLLEVAWQAIEDAGHAATGLAGSRTGVFIGIGNSDYSREQTRSSDGAQLDIYSATGNALSIAANRISYTLDLRGPSLSVDTACSSSLVAIHLACQSLQRGESTLALAGGVNLILSPDTGVVLSQARMLAPDGKCKVFDAAADGYVRGEGCGVVVLKRLSEALAANDRIAGVILSSAVNQDGRTNGLTAPNGPAQSVLIREALGRAGVSAGEIGYIEAHGTGTPLGDPIEVQSLAEIFVRAAEDEPPCWMGSVKANVGHLETAAGVASLIKTLLALRHGAIPRQVHLTNLNPRITLERSRLQIPRVPVPWVDAGPRRLALVNSFGFGGTNAALVVSEAPVRTAAGQGGGGGEGSLLVAPPQGAAAGQGGSNAALVVGEPSAQAVVGRGGNGEAGNEWEGPPLVAAPQGAAVGQRGGAARNEWEPSAQAVVGRGGNGEAGNEWEGPPLVAAPQGAAVGQRGGAARNEWEPSAQAAVGQGSGGTARNEWESSPLVATPPTGAGHGGAAAGTEWEGPARAVVGRGSGGAARNEWEPSAQAAVGRGSGGAARNEWESPPLVATPPTAAGQGGGGAAGTKGEGPARAAAGQGRSGVDGNEWEGSALAAARRAGEAGMGGTNKTLVVGEAPARLHLFTLSARTERARCELARRHADRLEAEPVPLGDLCFTANTGRVHFACRLAAMASSTEELSRWLREFSGGGMPAGVAVSTVEGVVRGEPVCPEPAHGRAAMERVRDLYLEGFEIDWAAFHAGSAHHRVALPTYPFERERFWVEPTPAAAEPAVHLRPLLERRLPAALPVFEVRLSTETMPWLADHRLRGQVIFPAAGYLEMALEAAAEHFGEGSFELTGIAFEQALFLQEREALTVQVIFTSENDGETWFRILSQPTTSEAWTLHCRGKVRPAERPAARPCPSPSGIEIAAENVYRMLARGGLEYGETFRGLKRAWRDGREAAGTVGIHSSLEPVAGDFAIHPAFLDSCLHVLAAVQTGSGSHLPACIQRFLWNGAFVTSGTVHATVEPAAASAVQADLQLWDEAGRPVLEMSGIRLQSFEAREAAAEAADRQNLLYELRWERANPAPEPASLCGRWWIVPDRGGAAEQLSAAIVRAGGVCEFFQEGTVIPADLAGVVCLAGLDAPSDPAQADVLRESESLVLRALAVVKALASAPSPKLWLVTRGAQSDAPVQSCLWGLGRVIALEYPQLRCTLVDLDAETGVEALLAELAVSDGESQVALRSGEGPVAQIAGLPTELAPSDGENQVALRSGEGSVAQIAGIESSAGRLHTERLVARIAGIESGAESGEMAVPGAESYFLAAPSLGNFEALTLSPCAQTAPAPGQVEVRVRAAGLNFSDVMKAMGLYPGSTAAEPALGAECAGVVERIGEGVTAFRPGDEVMGIAPHAFSPFATTEAALLVRKPSGLSFAEAAASPVAFLTAAYALSHLARIRAGESILIHSGAGGVGLAALQLAQRAGATVYATAGSPEKRAFLESLGVAAVFDSRSLDFAAGILQVTGGRGVDVVLNSLAGEAMSRSLELVAPHGRFVEIGKADIFSNRQVGLAPFQRAISYFAVDLDRMFRERGEVIREMLSELAASLESGALRPLPLRLFGIQQTREAFRYMAQARHIGKIVLSPAAPAGPLLRPDATYLITGGLGALGLRTAAWMAGAGARHIVLAGRHEPSTAAAAAIGALERRGVAVAVKLVDVSEAEQLDALMAEIRGMPPLRGVVHAAGVLADATLAKLDAANLRAVLAPKVAGAWLLHQRTAGLPLDFFVMYSSLAATLGSPGQGSYAAANAFLDGLADYRKARGLPALALNWGPWEGDGMAARAGFSFDGIQPLDPARAFEQLESLLRSGRAGHAVAAAVDWQRLADRLPPGGATLLQLVARPETEAGRRKPASLREELLGSLPEERRSSLEAHILQHVGRVTGIPVARIDRGDNLGDLGIDSLTALELINGLEQTLQVSMPVTIMMSGKVSVATLAAHITDRLV